jgi:3',5'-cyclic AMP phosphodiesterase CpdA
MKLYAISDLHLGYEVNRQALLAMPYHPEDWLILAGDVGDTVQQLEFAFSVLVRRFARVIWAPGNHDLWTLPSEQDPAVGEARYQKLVALCQSYGILTPEDPYAMWPGEGPRCLIAPLFLLYDYSFRPEDVPLNKALAWAEETGVMCSDEFLLHPGPYATRAEWCRARCEYTERRLMATPEGTQLILINHFPLREDLIRLKRIPRFSLWCGTRRTEDWHSRFPVLDVVYGHLHMRATDYREGVRFEEVSLGYPVHWKHQAGINGYLRQIIPRPETPYPNFAETIWHQ